MLPTKAKTTPGDPACLSGAGAVPAHALDELCPTPAPPSGALAEELRSLRFGEASGTTRQVSLVESSEGQV